jgi:hypothetical protein
MTMALTPEQLRKKYDIPEITGAEIIDRVRKVCEANPGTVGLCGRYRMVTLRDASSEEVFAASLRLQLRHRSIDCLLGTALIELGVNPAAFFEEVFNPLARRDEPVVLNGLPIDWVCDALGVTRTDGEERWMLRAQRMQDAKTQWGEIAKTYWME